ncbi:MAG: hypothetical protein ACLFO1_07085 [Spirochaetaceae bacterium]
MPRRKTARNRGAFSPNGDDVRGTVRFTPGIPDEAELLEWEFAVVNEDGDPVMERSDSDDLGEYG